MVDNLLPLLITRYEHPSAARIVDTILLSKEHVALLEAQLLANMTNYTGTLVQQMKKLVHPECAEFFKVSP